ncbi:hypothetical protein OXT66_00470 [Lentilactobacillus senioris]|uniref:hypothetical protein n=1 Tax=Lentilactobacillus senioris TaxID=931534 RepID=UPI00227FD4EC|nr:hypothetical protein [Lentilactobacillus senioris]MCY9806018.1 hypothetical protein [Lentilactobacillus senioris]
MAFHITVTDYVKGYFKKDNEQEQLHQFLTNQLPAYLTQRPAKIKPVHGEFQQLYELKVRVGRNFYRSAFFRNAEQIRVVYITDTLIKRKFDQEVTRFLVKQKNAI